MNIKAIAYKEFVQNIRDLKVMLIMTLFPILMIFLIGLAFTNRVGADTFQYDKTNFEYMVIGENRYLTDEISNQIQKVIDINGRWVEVDNRENSLEKLKNQDISLFIEINENRNNVMLYRNSENYKNATLIETLLKSHFKSKHLSSDISVAESYDIGDKKTTSLVKLPGDNSPNVFDYYGVSFLILFIVYGISNSITYTIKEGKQGNINRILLAPTPKLNLLIGKVIGGSLVNCIQVGIVFITTLLIFNVNWGTQITHILFLLITSIVMIVSLGTLIGLIFKNEGIALAFIHTLIVVFAFFGGSYVSLSDLGWLGEIGRFFSPIWWNVTGAINIIYEGNPAILNQTILLNVGLTFIFILIAWFVLMKKEVA